MMQDLFLLIVIIQPIKRFSALMEHNYSLPVHKNMYLDHIVSHLNTVHISVYVFRNRSNSIITPMPSVRMNINKK
jgi:hypothetical protein